MESFVINKNWIASLKLFINGSDVTSRDFGSEIIDNALDAGATEVEFSVEERHSSNDNVKRIKIYNNGKPLPCQDSKDLLLKLPVTKPDHHEMTDIGIRGVGSKLNGFRAGYISSITSYDGDQLYKLQLTPCSDDDGNSPIDVSTLTMSTYQTDVRSFKCECVGVEKSDRFTSEYGFEMELFWLPDAGIEYSRDALMETNSLRFSQKKNFNIYFKEDDTRHKMPKTYFGMMDGNGIPISEYSQLNKLNERIYVDDVPFEVYWGCKISPTYDIHKHKDYKLKTRSGNTLSMGSGTKGDQPLLIVMNHIDVVTHMYGRNWWSSWDSKTYNNLRIVVKPKLNINDKYGYNKNKGFSDDGFEERLGNAVIKCIKNNKIKSTYHNAKQKQEESEVEQFLEYILTNDFQNQEFRRLLQIKDKKILLKRNNWITHRPDASAREIDLRCDKGKVAFEFQKSTNPSDQVHCDGIYSRISLLCRENSPYETFVWVAKKHSHKSVLIDLLKGLKWADDGSHLKRVYFMTYDDCMSSFDYEDQEYVDIFEDVLEMSK